MRASVSLSYAVYGASIGGADHYWERMIALLREDQPKTRGSFGYGDTYATVTVLLTDSEKGYCTLRFQVLYTRKFRCLHVHIVTSGCHGPPYISRRCSSSYMADMRYVSERIAKPEFCIDW